LTHLLTLRYKRGDRQGAISLLMVVT